MSNTELLTVAYAEAHRASDVASRIWNAAHANEVVFVQEARGDIGALRRRLQTALAAATELENRANGNPPAKMG